MDGVQLQALARAPWIRPAPSFHGHSDAAAIVAALTSTLTLAPVPPMTALVAFLPAVDTIGLFVAVPQPPDGPPRCLVSPLLHDGVGHWRLDLSSGVAVPGFETLSAASASDPLLAGGAAFTATAASPVELLVTLFPAARIAVSPRARAWLASRARAAAALAALAEVADGGRGEGPRLQWLASGGGACNGVAAAAAGWWPLGQPTPRVDLVRVAAGDGHVAACSASGAAFVWGANVSGCLGIGRGLTALDRPDAVPALLGHVIVDVAAGSSHTLFLASNGTLFVSGSAGACGIGSRTPNALATAVALPFFARPPFRAPPGFHESAAAAPAAALGDDEASSGGDDDDGETAVLRALQLMGLWEEGEGDGDDDGGEAAGATPAGDGEGLDEGASLDGDDPDDGDDGGDGARPGSTAASSRAGGVGAGAGPTSPRSTSLKSRSSRSRMWDAWTHSSTLFSAHTFYRLPGSGDARPHGGSTRPSLRGHARAGMTAAAVADAGAVATVAAAADPVLQALRVRDLERRGAASEPARASGGAPSAAADAAAASQQDIVVGIAAGGGVSLVTTALGRVYAWGDSATGATGTGVVAASGSGATGGRVGAVLTREGALLTPLPVQALHQHRIVAAVTSGQHSLFISDDGIAFACGNGSWGRLGLGTEDDQAAPQRVRGLDGERVRGVAVGRAHSLFCCTSGAVYACGDNSAGQCGVACGPAKLSEWQSSSLSMPGHATNVLVAGWQDSATDAPPPPRRVPLPRRVDLPSGTFAEAVFATHDGGSGVVTTDGALFAWGSLPTTAIPHWRGGDGSGAAAVEPPAMTIEPARCFALVQGVPSLPAASDSLPLADAASLADAIMSAAAPQPRCGTTPLLPWPTPDGTVLSTPMSAVAVSAGRAAWFVRVAVDDAATTPAQGAPAHCVPCSWRWQVRDGALADDGPGSPWHYDIAGVSIDSLRGMATVHLPSAAAPVTMAPVPSIAAVTSPPPSPGPCAVVISGSDDGRALHPARSTPPPSLRSPSELLVTETTADTVQEAAVAMLPPQPVPITTVAVREPPLAQVHTVAVIPAQPSARRMQVAHPPPTPARQVIAAAVAPAPVGPVSLPPPVDAAPTAPQGAPAGLAEPRLREWGSREAAAAAPTWWERLCCCLRSRTTRR